ncbi:M14 family metallocarboxypeptidase [Ligaoa zhengdingensis]|uniref:M14 family metallopeptidase n=1 Tax=Ligaoa zhengdingensis TaxID=2763658 RepID=UPI0031BB406E
MIQPDAMRAHLEEVELLLRRPPTHCRVKEALFALRRAYPEQCRVFSIGRSVLGRELYAAAVGDTRGATLLMGGTHGLEWLTSLLMLRFLDDLLYSIAQNERLAEIDVKKSMETRGVIILPALNPDGIEIALRGSAGAGSMGERVQEICCGNYRLWQANARGVDLNHNFDAGWETLHKMEEEAGITGPAPTRYGGPRPESEPETRAITAFCREFAVRQAYAYHSQGEEIYYKYGEHTPTRSRLMAQLLATSSGYRLMSPEGLASHGGFKDWFIDKLRRPAFTIEIGKGKNPLPLCDLEPVYGRLREMMMLSLLL